MNYSTITQILFLIIAIAVTSTFTRPMLMSIKKIQDEIFIYADAKDKASEFNAKLNTVLAQEQAFQRSDLRDLDIYLPASIDTLTVMSDIEVIARTNNLILTSLASLGNEALQNDVYVEEEFTIDGTLVTSNQLVQADFKLSVVGDYDDFKAMLADLEKNKYPLDIVELQIGAVSVTPAASVTDAGTTDSTYNLTVRTYAFDYAQPQVIEATVDATELTI